MPSQGALELYELLKRAFPNRTIRKEFTIKHFKRIMYLDYYLPTLSLAFEFDGSQHDHYIKFFHGDKASFERSVQRDRSKNEWCESMGIKLIRFSSRDRIDLPTLHEKLKEANATKEKRN